MSNGHSAPRRPLIAHLIRVLAVPIILLWIAVPVVLTVVTPPLEAVADQHSVSLSPHNSVAFQSMLNIGKVFKQFDSDSSAMIVIEGQDKLGDSAHDYYNKIVAKLNADHTHVQNVQDFWGDPLTAAGVQSMDGKAAYVQVFLDGAQGTTPSHEAVKAVRDLVDSVPAPPGVKAYVTGNTVVVADTSVAGHKSMAMMALLSIVVIIVMLLMVYRSIVTMLLALVIVGIELFAAQGVTATAGNLNIIGLTPYAVSMVTMLAIAAGTDYVIFLLGRYQEARSNGQDRRSLLHRIPRGLARHHRFRIDHRRRVHVPDVDDVALLFDDGYAMRHRDFDGHCRGSDLGARDLDGGQSVRAARSQTRTVDARLAQGGYHRGAVAGPNHLGNHHDRHHRLCQPALLRAAVQR